MKNIIITFGTFLLILCAIPTVNGQINRTLETKVADILAQLPVKSMDQTGPLMQNIIDLEAEGILQFCDMLVPPGTGDDTQVRFAMHSLAVYIGGKEDVVTVNIVENTYIKAIEKTSDKEIKSFLIRRLAFCGTNTSVNYLSKFLSDDNLFEPALATMTFIGTQEAAESIFKAAKDADIKLQAAFVDALGVLKYEPSVDLLQELSNNDSVIIRQKSLMALAEIAMERSEQTILNATKKANFNIDDNKAILSYIRYGNRLNQKGMNDLSIRVAKNLLKYCNSESQLHFRTAGIDLLSENMRPDFTKTFIKESQNSNNAYRGAVLLAASQNMTSEDVGKWLKAYKKSSSDPKPQIIRMLSTRDEAEIYEKCILVALSDTDTKVRIAGIKALAFQDKSKALPQLIESLKQTTSIDEYAAIESTLLRICASEDNDFLSKNITNMNDSGKVVLINVLSARNAKEQFNDIVAFAENSNDTVTEAVFSALPSISTSVNLPKLFELLNSATKSQNIKNAQDAIIKAVDSSTTNNSKLIIDAFNSSAEKGKILPILPVLSDQESLDLVMEVLKSGSHDEKLVAIETLTNWRTNDALPILFQIASSSSNSELHAKAYSNYLSLIINGSFHDDQKLLLIKKLMPYSKSIDEDKELIRSTRNIKTFLSLVFVSNYLDKSGLESTAANTAIRIALPSPGKKDGLSGKIVRDIVSRSVDNLSGQDSQYIKIDVKEFLDNMSNEVGFVSIFNGNDLTGWEGLVKNPIERSKMSKRTLDKAQSKANEQMLKDWFVKEGVIGFKGEGYNNICTIKDYGDFEMIVDWKITNGGDSGIYLRGTPQVQIWDIARVDSGAEVGSGGLYNNQKNKSIPLTVADNPINDWNTFRIKMVGERVTVHLNGVLVTNNVILENYWDRKLPIFSKEAIELQAHGEDLGFRNIYVREINSGSEFLTEEEKKEGYQSLFNGKDLDQWIGNKVDYYAENNELLARPSQGGHGNLFTAEEYSDFIFRFEFKLTSGANNGLGIHAPLEGDVAYDGKEIQILDNTASIYANLKEYQYHGSVYGVIEAKRGFLKPLGEWNYEEVMVKGDQIKVTLNGTVILEGNMREASKNGTLDHKDHPGLNRNKGHIGFLGHGSELEFRNIRIKDLSK